MGLGAGRCKWFRRDRLLAVFRSNMAYGRHVVLPADTGSRLFEMVERDDISVTAAARRLGISANAAYTHLGA